QRFLLRFAKSMKSWLRMALLASYILCSSSALLGGGGGAAAWVAQPVASVGAGGCWLWADQPHQPLARASRASAPSRSLPAGHPRSVFAGRRDAGCNAFGGHPSRRRLYRGL